MPQTRPDSGALSSVSAIVRRKALAWLFGFVVGWPLVAAIAFFALLLFTYSVFSGVGGTSSTGSVAGVSSPSGVSIPGSLFPGIAATGNGPPSALAIALIPPDMLALYQSAEVQQMCPGLSWTIVASIIHQESDDNRNTGGIGGNGAKIPAYGASQFQADTWDSQGLLVVNVGTPYGEVTDGAGVDGDGDSLANIMDPYDSVPATARFLCAHGGGNSATLAQAIYDYNNADWYVYGGIQPNGQYFEGILPLAAQLASPDVDISELSVGSGSASPTAVNEAVDAALSQLGTPYIWADENAGVGFDCSGLMQWAWAQAGISIPRVAAAQYGVGIHVPYDQLQPGDMVFWGPDPTNPATISHVAMYIGNGEIVAAPHRNADVQVQSIYLSSGDAQNGYEYYVGAVRL